MENGAGPATGWPEIVLFYFRRLLLGRTGRNDPFGHVAGPAAENAAVALNGVTEQAPEKIAPVEIDTSHPHGNRIVMEWFRDVGVEDEFLDATLDEIFDGKAAGDERGGEFGIAVVVVQLHGDEAAVILTPAAHQAEPRTVSVLQTGEERVRSGAKNVESDF